MKEMIKTSLLAPNIGQIEGLPKNPRFIRDEKFKSLVKSLQDDPEMMDLRELIVIPYGGIYVVVCGNMRLRAGIEAGFQEMPCKVLDETTSAAKLRAYAIKDNNAWGENDWDILANEWDQDELKEWGVDVPAFDDNEEGPDTEDSESLEVPALIIICEDEKHRSQLALKLSNMGIQYKFGVAKTKTSKSGKITDDESGALTYNIILN